MVDLWIDDLPESGATLRHGLAMSALAAAQGVGSSVLGRVTATPQEEPGLPAGWVRAEIPADAPTSEVTGRTDGSIFAVGAVCLVQLDSSGRVVLIHAPLDLPEGATPVGMGVAGRWLLEHDEKVAAAAAEAAKAVEDAAAAVAAGEAAQARADEIAEQAVEDRARVEDAIEKAVSLEGSVSGLEGRLSAAESGVEGARSAAESAASDASAAKSAAAAAQETADAAGKDAAAAQSAAEAAGREAESAQNLASSAKSTADAAGKDAAAAKSQAASAVSAAEKAQAGATAARSTAESAQADADSAAAAAAAAQAEADRLRAVAEAAKTQAASAQSAAQAAQGTADAAKGDAKAASDRAAAARSAADAAQARADQAAQAAVDARNRADAAAASALGAQRTADAASAKATTASGLFTVSTRSPSTSDGSGKPSGAVWEVKSGGTLLRRYVWTGSAWQQVKAGQDFIGENAIGRAQIGAGAVGTLEVADGAITNAKIGDLTADKIKGTTAELDSAFMRNIVNNRIFTDEVYASRVSVAGGNLNPDPLWEDTEGWYSYAPSFRNYVTIGGGSIYTKTGRFLRIKCTTKQVGARYRFNEQSLIVEPGAKYRVRVTAYLNNTSTPGQMFNVYFMGYVPNNSTPQYAAADFKFTAANQYTVMEGTITVPANWRNNVVLGIDQRPPYTEGPVIQIYDVRIERMTGAVLIEDGAVTAEKINAKSVASETAKHIRLSTDQLYAGTAKIASELIAPTITGKTITGSHFNGGDMTFSPGPNRTVVNSTRLTQYQNNTEYGDIEWKDLVSPPFCIVDRQRRQTFNAAESLVWLGIAGDGAIISSGGGCRYINDTIIVPHAAYYLISGLLYIDNQLDITGYRNLNIKVNDKNIQLPAAWSPTYYGQGLQWNNVIHLEAGDKVQLWTHFYFTQLSTVDSARARLCVKWMSN